MAKETMLYFSKRHDLRAVFPARNYLGIDMSDATSMQISFLKQDGTADATIVDMTIDTGKAKEAAEVLAGALAGQSRGLTIIADTENNNFLHPFTAVEGIA